MLERTVKTVVNTVKSAASWVSNAIRNPKQTINNVKQAAYNGYQKAASATHPPLSVVLGMHCRIPRELLFPSLPT
ncbi:hypothetical protein M2145_002944 [Lachnospiraceae bacterium PF1-21]|uniref:hypothetical protein n=1 Tax=Ohessyouella blattaphilus TaxID=2949333 RepID=UPI003E2CD0EB